MDSELLLCSRRAALLLAVVAITLTRALLAQSAGTAGLTGAVTDPSGAVVPGVTVTLTNTDTNQSRNTTIKTTRIGERTNIQFRAEFFNLFNHPQFNAPNTALFASPLPDVNSPNFGRIISTSVNPRVIQLGLKFLF